MEGGRIANPNRKRNLAKDSPVDKTTGSTQSPWTMEEVVSDETHAAVEPGRALGQIEEGGEERGDLEGEDGPLGLRERWRRAWEEAWRGRLGRELLMLMILATVVWMMMMLMKQRGRG